VYAQKIYDYTSLRADILSFSRVHVACGTLATDNLLRVVVSAHILSSRGVPVALVDTGASMFIDQKFQ
jgi:hypothetical protein